MTWYSSVIYEEMFIEGAYDLDLVAFVPDAIVDCGAFEGLLQPAGGDAVSRCAGHGIRAERAQSRGAGVERWLAMPPP